MSTDYQQLYLKDTMKLAKTIVIKSVASAELLNDLISAKYGYSNLSSSDPKTWKYYMNLSGLYHETDTVMMVTSLDTLQEIQFTKDNLTIHTATASAYEFGSRFYYGLVNRYPDQEQLILGILYPTDIDEAISAEDCTILTYPTGLVEPQENTLIHELQEWIYRFKQRWDVQAFGVSHSLYATAQHAIMYLQIVPKLLNLRLKRCKTSEAHSFHIRMYLASHCGLDKYYDYMTTKQALFFYRNINYIQLNAGKQSTFDWLVEKILTDRKIPIAEFQARLKGIFDDSYYPEYEFKKIPINTDFNTPNQDYYTLDSVLGKENSLAAGNLEEIYYHSDVIDTTFKNSPSSIVLTKALESSMIDYTGNESHSLSNVLFSHWGWLSASNLYHVAVSFKDPKTGDIRSLYSDDAFIYYILIAMQGLGIQTDIVPPYFLERVQKLYVPSKAELLNGTSRDYIEDDTVVDWLIANQPRIRAVYSVSTFKTLCTSIFETQQKQWYLTSRTEDMKRHAMTKKMVDTFYNDRVVEFSATGMLISDWMRSKSLPQLDYTVAECLELMGNLFNAATGYATDPTKLLSNIQKAMISIMTELSSYSIQFIQQINNSPIIPVNFSSIRIGDHPAKISDDRAYNVSFIQGSDSTIVRNDVTYRVNPCEYQGTAREQVSHTFRKDFGMKMSMDKAAKNLINHNISSLVITAKYPEHDPSVYASNPYQTPSIGIETFYNLTLEERLSIVDIYGSSVIYQTNKSGASDIHSVINNETINFVDFTPVMDRDINL